MDLYDDNSLKNLFEAAPEMAKVGSKKVAVVIGRFNPPTIGHYKLISQAIKEMKTNPKFKGIDPFPVIIVIGSDEKHEKMLSDLESGNDKDKAKAIKELARNPLTVADRIAAMQQSGKINIIPKSNFITASNPFVALSKIRELHFEPIAVVAGSDRSSDEAGSSEYIKMLDKYFMNDDGSPIKHLEVSIERKGEGKPADKDAFVEKLLSAMKSGKELTGEEASGSVARRAVSLGYKEEFAKITGLEDKPALASKLFSKIEKAIKR